MKYKQDLRKDWSERAQLYHEHYVLPRAGPFQSVDRLIEVADLRTGQKVLDVATGTGIVAMEALNKVRKEGKVVSIDFSPGPLEIAKKQTRYIEFLEMDAEKLEFEDESFDTALSQFALFFFPDTQKALNEIKRVLLEKAGLQYLFMVPRKVFHVSAPYQVRC